MKASSRFVVDCDVPLTLAQASAMGLLLCEQMWQASSWLFELQSQGLSFRHSDNVHKFIAAMERIQFPKVGAMPWIAFQLLLPTSVWA